MSCSWSWVDADTKQKRRINDDGDDVDPSTFKPCARFLPTGGREYTVSIAVPGSIITE